MLEILAAIDPSSGAGMGIMGAAIGAGLAGIGAGLGLGKISAANAESIARQPDAAGKISGTSQLLAFLLEGVCLFACVIAIMGVLSLSGAVNTALTNAKEADAAHAEPTKAK